MTKRLDFYERRFRENVELRTIKLIKTQRTLNTLKKFQKEQIVCEKEH